MTVSEKVAYVQGMFDGMGLDKDESKEAKVLSGILDVLKDVGMELEDLDDGVTAVCEAADAIADDLREVQEAVFEDEGEDEEDECCCGHRHHHHAEGIYEAVCPNCGQELQIDEATLEEGSIDCPSCGQKYALSLEDDEEESD